MTFAEWVFITWAFIMGFAAGLLIGFALGVHRRRQQLIDRYGGEIVIPPNSGKTYRASVELQPWDFEADHSEAYMPSWLVDGDPGRRP